MTPPAPGFVVQLSGADAARWLEYRDGLQCAEAPGWRDDADLLIVSPGPVDDLARRAPAAAGSRVLVGAADEEIGPLPPFDLGGPLPLTACRLASMTARLVFVDAPFGPIVVDATILEGTLVDIAAPESRTPVDAPVDLTLTVPFEAFLAFRAGLVDLSELVAVVEIQGHPSFLFLFVALLDGDALRAVLHRRPNTMAALAAWSELA